MRRVSHPNPPSVERSRETQESQGDPKIYSAGAMGKQQSWASAKRVEFKVKDIFQSDSNIRLKAETYHISYTLKVITFGKKTW
jgi:hypothetical protein